MVVNLYLQGLGGENDFRRRFDIAAAGIGIARRMVVNEDQPGCADLQRPAHDLARIDRGFEDRSPADDLVADQPVAAVEEQHPELLALGMGLVEHQIIEQRPGIGQ